MMKAKDYSGMASNGGKSGMGTARDFSSTGASSGSVPTNSKAKSFYGGTDSKAKSMGSSKGETAPRSIPGMKTTMPMPAGGTRQITLPRGATMARKK